MSDSRKAGSKEFRNALEERKGSEWYNSASKVGELHDPRIDDNKGKQMYSGAEIRAEMRHGRDGMTTEELTKQYEDLYASGKINLNGNAKDFLTQHHGASLNRANKGGGNDSGPDPIATAPVEDKAPTPVQSSSPAGQSIDPGNPGGLGGGYGPNVNVNQDNDINTNITGSNNNVSNMQDNSVNTYGGSSYNGNSGSKFKDAWMQNFFN